VTAMIGGLAGGGASGKPADFKARLPRFNSVPSPASTAVVVFLPGEARDFGSKRRFNPAALIAYSVREPVKTVHSCLPEESALRGDLEGAIGDSAQIGDVPLPRLAVNPHALDQDRAPMYVLLSRATSRLNKAIPGGAVFDVTARISESRSPAFAFHRTNIRNSVVYKFVVALVFLMHYASESRQVVAVVPCARVAE